MDITTMGKKTSEALALKGKVDSLSKQIDETKAQIRDTNKEIDRLNNLIPIRDEAVNKLAGLESEVNKTQSELTDRLDALAQEGIILPLDNLVQNRIVRL